MAPVGSPSHIQVVGSSLSTRVDAAAVKALGDMVLRTSCPGKDFRIYVTFQLMD